MTWRARPTGTRGFALVAVAWFLVLIAAIGTYLIANARSQSALARNILAAAHAEALADAGIAAAVFNQTDPNSANRWALDGLPHALTLGGGTASVRLQDETAKVNPNTASEDLLAGLLQAVGVDKTRGPQLAAAIADWIGAETEPRPGGAKLPQYRSAGKSYGPPNAPVESLDELQLVLGMTPEIFAAMRLYLTLYTIGADPQPKNATAVVRTAIALATREDARSENAVQQANTDPDAPPPATPAPQPKAEEQVLEIESAAQSADGGSFIRYAVVRIDSAKPKGYAVLAWRRIASPD